MAVMVWDYVEVLLECDVPALEARIVDDIAGAARRQRARGGFHEWRRREPIPGMAVAAKAVWRCGGRRDVPALRTSPLANTCEVVVGADGEWLAGLRLGCAGELPIAERPTSKKVAEATAVGNVPDVIHDQGITNVEIAGSVVRSRIVIVR